MKIKDFASMVELATVIVDETQRLALQRKTLEKQLTATDNNLELIADSINITVDQLLDACGVE